MNKYLIRVIVAPTEKEDKFIYFISKNHFTSVKKEAKHFDTREEALKISKDLEFENEIVLEEAKIYE